MCVNIYIYAYTHVSKELYRCTCMPYNVYIPSLCCSKWTGSTDWLLPGWGSSQHHQSTSHTALPCDGHQETKVMTQMSVAKKKTAVVNVNYNPSAPDEAPPKHCPRSKCYSRESARPTPTLCSYQGLVLTVIVFWTMCLFSGSQRSFSQDRPQEHF